MYRAKTEWMKKKWFLDTVDNISELESHLWTGPVATGALSFKVAPQLRVPRFSAPRFEESPEKAFIQSRTATKSAARFLHRDLKSRLKRLSFKVAPLTSSTAAQSAARFQDPKTLRWQRASNRPFIQEIRRLIETF
jgi:hypothetical protein